MSRGFAILEEHDQYIVVRTPHATHPHLPTLLLTGNGWHDAVQVDGLLKHDEDDVLTLHWSQSKEHLLKSLEQVCAHCERYPV